MTVSVGQRLGLVRVVSGLRRVFEGDLARLAEGRFGIYASGRRAGVVDDVSALSLSSHDLVARSELVGVVDYLRADGLTPREAVERMLREAVFTTVNRLLAIRVAEAMGVLPPALATGQLSDGFKEALEVFPLLREADSSGGYWTYLQICGDELSHAVPRLFDRRHPLSVLTPSAEALEEAVELLSDPELADVWGEPETLGWSYQFFNTQDERRAMRDASAAPRTSHELAVRTQVFTPAFLVDFLVQNTLGRRLKESGFELDLPLLLGEIDPKAPPLDLDNVSVLDPAVGSGHFLLGAYDLLEKAWAERGISPADAAPRILRSLFGIEIDPRAAQVAQTVLYLRARQSAPNPPLDPPRIVTARALPKDPPVRNEVLTTAPPEVREVVEGLDKFLSEASLMGSLLRPEEYLKRAIDDRLSRPRLGDSPTDGYRAMERTVLDTALRLASAISSTPSERLFAADAKDALSFVELTAQRFDTVVMNPPFGQFPQATGDIVRRAYPGGHVDLFAAFAIRGVELLNPHGYLGALAARPGFFLISFQEWRERLVLDRLVAMVDLGYGAVEEVLVETAAYVLTHHPGDLRVPFRRLTKQADKEAAMYAADSVFLCHRDEFAAIPGVPLSYWVSDEVRSAFTRLKPLRGKAEVRQGLATADDFRFVRCWWEVSSGDIGRHSRWVWFAKGGEYSPVYSNIHLLVDWEDNGRRIRAWGRGRVQNTEFYFRPGLTWPVVTTSAFGPYALPSGCIFSHKGGVVLPRETESAPFGALLAGRVARHFLSTMLPAGEETASGTPIGSYEIGVVQRLPWPSMNSNGSEWVRLFGILRLLRGAPDETDTNYRGNGPHTAESSEVLMLEALELSRSIDETSLAAYSLSKDAQTDIDREQGLHPTAYPLTSTVDSATFRALYQLSEADLVGAALGFVGGARYLATKSFFVDRRLELLAHSLRAHPRQLIELRQELGLVRDEELVHDAEGRLSYLVGCGFGRWDVRVGRDPSLAPPLGDPFDPLPVCPPGMLTGDDSLPVAEAPVGYPLVLPPDRILHDDPGHRWDIVRAVEAAAEFMFDDPDQELRSALSHLKVKDLRSYFRGKFFSHHLSRYSKSRRKAPIYWYLAVPSKQWGLWVYSPWLSREQLFAIARAAQDKLRRLLEEASQLRKDLAAGEERSLRERLETADELSREMQHFNQVAERIAQFGWEPDLNDGIILNAAPLEELFADPKWRKDIAEHRTKMEQGEYPWATSQATYYQRSNP